MEKDKDEHHGALDNGEEDSRHHDHEINGNVEKALEPSKHDIHVENDEAANVGTVFVDTPSNLPGPVVEYQRKSDEGPLDLVKSTPDIIPSPGVKGRVAFASGRSQVVSSLNGALSM